MKSTQVGHANEPVRQSWGRFSEVLFYSLILIQLLLILPLGQCADLPAQRLTHDGRSYSRVGLGWSPDGRHILFSKQYEDGVQLWVMDADGTNAKAVSRVGWQENWGWSPDSKKIVYAYAEKRNNSMQGSLVVYNMESGQTRQLASGFRWIQFEDFSGWAVLEWTDDSREFAMLMKRFADNTPRADSYLFNVETGRSVGLTPNHHSAGKMYAGSWSPDNNQFALVSKTSPSANPQVYVCKRDGSDLHAITPPDWNIISDPRWSPKGDRIAFCTTYQRLENEKAKSLCDLWLVSPDGKNAKPLTQGSSPSTENRFDVRDPEWTADGRYIVCWGRKYDQAGNAYAGLYLIDPDTGSTTPIIANDPDSDQFIDGFRDKLSLSKDGKALTFSVVQYTITGKTAKSPEYQEERSILYYYDISSRTLRELARARSVEEGQLLWSAGFNWRPFISPDGKKLLLTRAKILSQTDGKYEPDLYVCQLEDAESPETSNTEPQTNDKDIADISEQSKQFAPGAAVLVIPGNRPADQIAEALPESYRSMYRVDKGLNALVVSAPDPATLDLFKRDVDLLDRCTPQILVDVMVTELTDDASKQLGLDWKAASDRFGVKLPLLNGLDPGQAFYQGVGTLNREFFSTLSALEEQGKAKVHANPRVLASCGTEATINIRRTDNFLFESGTDNQGRPVRSRSDIAADTILIISPQLMANSKIAMKVDATVDSFIFGAKNDLPDTTRRRATTQVVCRDGETIVIGGLSLEEETTKVRKTPVLGDLPLIGGLFRSMNRSTKTSNLVILVSPHIITADEN